MANARSENLASRAAINSSRRENTGMMTGPLEELAEAAVDDKREERPRKENGLRFLGARFSFATRFNYSSGSIL